jgi:cytochrome c peroxidase
MPGAIAQRFGNRKPPSAAYAGDSPLLQQDLDGSWFGGMFWDGRATGAVLGDPLAEQAMGPFLNPLEQAIPNARVLCVKVKSADYAGLFEEVWGSGSLSCTSEESVSSVYEQIGRSVAAYERSREVNPFTSKFDLFWDNALTAGKDVTKIKCGTGGGGMGGGGMGGGMGCPGGGMDLNRWTTYRNLGLSDAELQGLASFNDPGKGNCASCHKLSRGPDGYPLFTDFGYHNLGIPKNPENPFYGMPKPWNPDGVNWVDNGLGGYLKSAGYDLPVYEPELGKHKTPTLRNVDKRLSPDFVKTYGHNGYFNGSRSQMSSMQNMRSLEEIVFFYHWRAAMDSGMGGGMGGGMDGNMASMFPAPEVDQNRTMLDFFPRSLEAGIVAFMKTLSDGYFQR